MQRLRERLLKKRKNPGNSRRSIGGGVGVNLKVVDPKLAGHTTNQSSSTIDPELNNVATADSQCNINNAQSYSQKSQGTNAAKKADFNMKMNANAIGIRNNESGNANSDFQTPQTTKHHMRTERGGGFGTGAGTGTEAEGEADTTRRRRMGRMTNTQNPVFSTPDGAATTSSCKQQADLGSGLDDECPVCGTDLSGWFAVVKR